MKIIPFLLIASFFNLAGCQNNIPMKQPEQTTNFIIEKPIQKIKSDDKSIGFNDENKEIFYVQSQDIINPKKFLLQSRVPAILMIYNNCLSLKVLNQNDKIYTLIIPNSNKILFDNGQNIIGLESIKSNKKIFIGDLVSLNGFGGYDASSSKKIVPKECSQHLISTAEVEKPDNHN